MSDWTIERVAARFDEAARISHRLPAAQVQGYFNTWPTFRRAEWETYAAADKQWRFPPDPAAIERLMETMRWVAWLEEEQRHLLWMRAEHCPWREICRRFACDRTTAWRRWQRALQIVATRLNGMPDREKMGNAG